MFVAHLPAGYIVSRLVSPLMAPSAVSRSALLVAALAGSVFPDLDLLYFHLIDGRRHHHHRYLTHLPWTWGLALLVAWLGWRCWRRSRLAPLALMFCLNGFVHLLLDSVVGQIWWLAPFVDRPYSLFRVAARHEPWWLNFVLHGSFVFELGLLTWAWLLWSGRCRRPANPG